VHADGGQREDKWGSRDCEQYDRCRTNHLDMSLDGAEAIGNRGQRGNPEKLMTRKEKGQNQRLKRGQRRTFPKEPQGRLLLTSSLTGKGKKGEEEERELGPV